MSAASNLKLFKINFLTIYMVVICQIHHFDLYFLESAHDVL